MLIFITGIKVKAGVTVLYLFNFQTDVESHVGYPFFIFKQMAITCRDTSNISYLIFKQITLNPVHLGYFFFIFK